MFSVKVQIVIILGFVGHSISVTITQICLCIENANIGNV